MKLKALLFSALLLCITGIVSNAKSTLPKAKKAKTTDAPVITYPAFLSFTGGKNITPVTPVNTGGTIPAVPYGMTTTLVQPDPAFSNPANITVDGQGNVYVAEQYKILKITSAGITSILAGSGAAGFVNGTGTAARFGASFRIVSDAAGNIFVNDAENQAIRKVTPAGVVTTFATITGTVAAGQRDIALDAQNNIIVVTGSGFTKITPDGVKSTLPGFLQFNGFAVDPAGVKYVTAVQCVAKIGNNGSFTIIAGDYENNISGFNDGPGNQAVFNYPRYLAVDGGYNVYVTESGASIRRISPTGFVSTLAGLARQGGFVDGPGIDARFSYPLGVAADANNSLYVVDATASSVPSTYRIRKVNTTGYKISPALPAGLIFDTATGTISGNSTVITSPTTYTVTAYNGSGQTQTTFTAEVINNFFTFNQPPAKTYGDADFGPGATSPNRTVPIVYTSSDPNVATIVDGKIHILNAGTTTITASQGTDGSYPAATISRVLTVDKAPQPLSFALQSETKIWGDADYTPNVVIGNAGVPVTFTSSNTNVAAILNGKIHMVNAGTVKIIATQAGDANHLPTSVNQNLTISKRIINALAESKTKAYGTPDPPLTYKITTGTLVNGDSFTGALTRTAGENPGTYGINALNFQLPVNYNLTFSTGNFTITGATEITPTLQATNVNFTNITPTSANISWTNGNGTYRAVFIARNLTSGSPQPVNTITYPALGYGNASAAIGSTNWYCIYNGTGSSVTATGLPQSSTYRVMVIEYNGIAATEHYLLNSATANPANFTTGSTEITPTLQATNVNFTNITTTSANISWTNGNGAYRAVFIARNLTSGSPQPANTVTYPALGYGNANAAIGATGWYCMYNGTGSSATATGLSQGSTYRVMVVEYNGAPATERYLLNSGTANPGNFGTISTDASLSNLTLDVAALSPAFINTITSYGASVTANITNVSVTASALNANAIITINGVAAQSGIPSAPIAISPGNNTLNILVTAQDGVATQAFTIAVSKATAAPDISYTPSTLVYLQGTAITPAAPVNTGGSVPKFAYGTLSTVNTATTGYDATTISKYKLAGMVADSRGNIFIVDGGNNVIRKMTAAGQITTYAGALTAGYVEGGRTTARFNNPAGLAIDASDNIYVCDAGNNRIRMITSAGVVSTFAGTGTAGNANGNKLTASFYDPAALSFDKQGNLYIVDRGNNVIRMITPAGIVSTIAGNGLRSHRNGPGAEASFYAPSAIFADALGNCYVAEDEGMIRKITPNRDVSDVLSVKGAAISGDASGNIYFSNAFDNKIYKLAPDGNISTFGNGSTEGNRDGLPGYIETLGLLAVDNAGGLYFGDGQRIRKALITGYTISPALPGLKFDPVTGIISGAADSVFYTKNYTITAINSVGSSTTNVSIRVKSTIANASALTASAGVLSPFFTIDNYNYSLKVNRKTDSIRFTVTAQPDAIIKINGMVSPNAALSPAIPLEPHDNNIIIVITAGDGTTKTYTVKVTRVVETPQIAYPVNKLTFALDRDISPVVPVNTGGTVPAIAYGTTSTFNSYQFSDPKDITVDGIGNFYVEDGATIKKIRPDGEVIAIGSYATDYLGVIRKASIVADPTGNIYIQDSRDAIMRMTPQGAVTTIANLNNNTGSNQAIPGIVLDAQNNIFAISGYFGSDGLNSTFTKITLAGQKTALPGGKYFQLATDKQGNFYTYIDRKLGKISPSGAQSLFPDGPTTDLGGDYPTSMTADGNGNVYLTEPNSSWIRKVSPDGVITVLAGSEKDWTYVDGVGSKARFSFPTGIVTDADNNVYVCDYLNHVVRKVIASGYTISPGLPAGMTFDSATGAIGGTPTVETPLTAYTVTAYNKNGEDRTVINIETTVFQPQVLTFDDLPAKAYGDADFTVEATSNYADIPITYSSNNTAVATVTGNKVHITGAGSAYITATQAGYADYAPTTNTSQLLTVAKANISIAADAKSKIYGSADPVLTYTIKSGSLINADAFTGALTRDAGESPGIYTIKQGTLDLGSSYNLSYQPGALTISAQGGNLPPTVQTINVTFNNTTATSSNITWTSGNGAARAVFIARTANGSITPANNTFYAANTNFGSGAQVGSTGWYCIYNGTGSAATVTGLSSDYTYRVQVVEYNGAINQELYLASPNAPANVTTPLTTPTAITTLVTFNNTTATSTGISWTNGNGTARAVFIALTSNGSISPLNNTYYSANANFKNGSQVGTTGWYCIYNGSGNSTTVTGLINGNTYRVQVVEYNGAINHERYLSNPAAPANVSTPPAAPTVAALQVKFNTTTATSTGITWTNGNGSARAVFIAKTNNGSIIPNNNTYYSSNANFGNGSQVNATGWYCIYNGTGSSATVTGLTSGAVYRVQVVEYNGPINHELYLNSPSAPANVTTQLAAPTMQSIQVKFNNTTSAATGISWTSGNGAARAVFISKTANGSVSPADNTYYSSNANFGNGKQVGTTGWYCIYNGTGNSTTVTGLSTGTTYRVQVVEYNGSINNELYLTSPNSPANVTTPLAAPTTQALQVKFNNTLPTATGISWTNGNGMARAVFIAKTANGNVSPANNTYYSSNPNFGNGKQVGTSGWYCIYNGTGNSTTVTGLSTGTTYRVQVVEYNGAINSELYLTSPNSPANVTTPLAAPTSQALLVKFNNTTNYSTGITWTNGNGAARAVFIAKTANGNTTPVNNTYYSANSNFGNGSQVGATGWYCIYNGTGNSTTVAGLASATTYRVQVVEYNGAINHELYLASPSSPANVTTPGGSGLGSAADLNSLTLIMAPDKAAVTDQKIVAANILSPNGDGKNDTWVIKNIALYPLNTVTVIDNAGKTLFTKRGYSNDWDGRYQGNVLNEGTYNYSIDPGDGSGVIRGFVTLVKDR